MRRIEDIARTMFPKTVTLKDGTPVTLRPMVKEDAGKLFEFFKRVPPEDRVFFKEDVTRRDVIDAWARALDYEKILPLLAEVDGRIVADATLHRRAFGWMSHVGRLRVATAEDFRHRGLGSKLVEALIQVAREAEAQDLIGWMVWTAFDFEPPPGQEANYESFFGLWTLDLAPKAALAQLPLP